MNARKKQPEKVPLLRRPWNYCKRHKLAVLGGVVVIAYGIVSNVVSVPINQFVWSKLLGGPQQETKRTISQVVPIQPIQPSDEPSPPEDYPSLDAIPDKPSKNEVRVFALGEKKQVALRYKNTTSIRLKLLVLNWQEQYFPGKGLADKTDGWHAWPFPATTQFILNKEFPLGWYLLQ